jgi:hypothetical protein
MIQIKKTPVVHEFKRKVVAALKDNGFAKLTQGKYAPYLDSALESLHHDISVNKFSFTDPTTGKDKTYSLTKIGGPATPDSLSIPSYLNAFLTGEEGLFKNNPFSDIDQGSLNIEKVVLQSFGVETDVEPGKETARPKETFIRQPTQPKPTPAEKISTQKTKPIAPVGSSKATPKPRTPAPARTAQTPATSATQVKTAAPVPTTAPSSVKTTTPVPESKTEEPVVSAAKEVVPEKPKKSEPTQEPKKVVPPKKKIDVGKKEIRGTKKQAEKIKKTEEEIQEQKRLDAIQMAPVPEEIIQRQKEIVFGEELTQQFNEPLDLSASNVRPTNSPELPLDFSEEQKPEQLPLPLDKLKQPTRTIGDVPEKEYFLDQIRNAVRLSSTTGQSEENINTQQEFLKSFSQNLKSMNVELLADLKGDEKDVLEQTLKAITDLQTDTNEKFEKSILRLVKIGEEVRTLGEKYKRPEMTKIGEDVTQQARKSLFKKYGISEEEPDTFMSRLKGKAQRDWNLEPSFGKNQSFAENVRSLGKAAVKTSKDFLTQPPIEEIFRPGEWEYDLFVPNKRKRELLEKKVLGSVEQNKKNKQQNELKNKIQSQFDEVLRPEAKMLEDHSVSKNDNTQPSLFTEKPSESNKPEESEVTAPKRSRVSRGSQNSDSLEKTFDSLIQSIDKLIAALEKVTSSNEKQTKQIEKTEESNITKIEKTQEKVEKTLEKTSEEMVQPKDQIATQQGKLSLEPEPAKIVPKQGELPLEGEEKADKEEDLRQEQIKEETGFDINAPAKPEPVKPEIAPVSSQPQLPFGDGEESSPSTSGSGGEEGSGSIIDTGMNIADTLSNIPGTGKLGKKAKAITRLAKGKMKKILGKGAGKIIEKEGVKVAEKAGLKLAGKEAAKIGGKALGKSLLKKIPLAGLLAGGAFAAQRAMSGDWSGAGLELASGAASTLPGFGTAASVGIDAALAARDMGVFGGGESSTTPLAETGTNNVSMPMAQLTEDATPPPFIANPSVPQTMPTSAPSESTPPIMIERPSLRSTDNSFVRFNEKRHTWS